MIHPCTEEKLKAYHKIEELTMIMKKMKHEFLKETELTHALFNEWKSNVCACSGESCKKDRILINEVLRLRAILSELE